MHSNLLYWLNTTVLSTHFEQHSVLAVLVIRDSCLLIFCILLATLYMTIVYYAASSASSQAMKQITMRHSSTCVYKAHVLTAKSEAKRLMLYFF